MRNLKAIGGILATSLFVLISGCGLDPAPDTSSEEAVNGQTVSDPSASVDPAEDSDAVASDAFDPRATPTCNWVASFAGAWVPEYLPTNSVDCNMVRGTHSAAVQKLQHSMNLCYGEHLVEDSDFGGNTEAALIRTQRTAGTRADGEYGPNTRKAMLHQGINGGCVRVP